MKRDITYCVSECDNLECPRHQDNIPKNVITSVSFLKGTKDCEEYEDPNEKENS